MQIVIGLSDYETELEYYFDRSVGLDIRSFGFDLAKSRLIIVYHSIKKKRELYLRIIDIHDSEENEVLFDLRLVN